MTQQPSAQRWSLLIAMWAFALFTVIGLMGYAAFIWFADTLIPLIRPIDWAWTFYTNSYRIFAEWQIWLGMLAFAIMLLWTVRWQWALSFLVVCVLTLGVETLGTNTGIPFSPYVYDDDLLGTKVFGHVPLVIPISWFFMAVPSYLLAGLAFPGRTRPLYRVMLAAFILTMWDFALDPAMSHAVPYWSWLEAPENENFYGMPWVNWLGWYVTSLLVMGFFWLARADRWIDQLPLTWNTLFYGLNLILPLGMVIVNGHWGAVIFTLVAVVLVSLILREGWLKRRSRPSALMPNLPEDTQSLEPAFEALNATLATDQQAQVSLSGQSLRPRVALQVHDALFGGSVPPGFWQGAAAIQMVHEASLLHDDIVDNATQRRGEHTLLKTLGAPAALLQGDHLLTTAYRLAAETGNPVFIQRFAQAVERTVHGEMVQAESLDTPSLPQERYDTIIAQKTGSLFGLAAALPAILANHRQAAELERLGQKLGALYQRVDDLLDYLPGAETGKATFQDFENRVWTWPLSHLARDESPFDVSTVELRTRLTESTNGDALASLESAMSQSFSQFRAESESALGQRNLFESILSQWENKIHSAIERTRTGELSMSPDSDAVSKVMAHANTLPSSEEALMAYFAVNSRSFRFASRLFPAGPRRLVSSVYAYCRFTDDLVDEADTKDPQQLLERLQVWENLTQTAYRGESSGIPILDSIMQTSAERGVPANYALELIEGMRMDLTKHRYDSLEDLYGYTYRVASVVGTWLTEIFDVHDAWVLDRAADLGHAFQITNILRDVGEDWARGRQYLPTDLLTQHQLAVDDLAAFAEGRQALDDRYVGLMESMMRIADGHYMRAKEGIPALPKFFQRPVIVAAHVYRGIHDQIRGHGYDNFRNRAHTSARRKLRLAIRALWSLRRLEPPASAMPISHAESSKLSSQR